MTRIAAAAAGCALLVGVAACGADRNAEWRGTVRDSAGVTIVSNTGGGVWAAGAGWTAWEELRIGVAEGDPRYQFGQVIGVDVDGDGRIYIIDQQAREVRVFGPDGRYVRTIGKAGSGPGELSPQAGPVFVGPDGAVIVPDLMNQRINRYSALGEPEGSTPLPMTEGIPMRWLKASNQDLVQQSLVMALPGMEVEPRNLVLRRDPAGAIRDTVLVLPVGESADFSSGQPRFKLFSPEAMWAIDAEDRLIHGRNDQYRLEVRSADGTLERIVEKRGLRRPVTAGDQATFRRVIRAAWERAGVPPDAIEMMMQGVSFADTYPAYANILGGPGGTLWVQSVQTPETVEEQGGAFDFQDVGGPTWDVFGPDGRLLGEVRLPHRFNPLLFQGDRFYGVLRDELDVQYVAALRVGPAAEAER
jgi:hypothetical protein